MNRTVRLFFLLLAMIGFFDLIVMPAVGTCKNQKKTVKFNQFTIEGHVLGFSVHGMYVVGGDHLLNVEFCGTEGIIMPVVQETDASSGPTLPANVAYYNLWPGIDLAYEATAGAIVESIYTLAPDADASLIRLRYNVPVTIGPDGALHIKFKTGIMQESAPIAWQEIDGQRIPVEIAFNLPTHESNYREVGFTLGQYDRTHPLIIDPVLQWNTFMGFEGDSYNEYANAIALDSSGNVYVTGESRGNWGSPLNAYAGGSDIFVAKLNNFGVLQWSTFLGSASTEYGLGIAVDSSYDVYVTGRSDETWGSPVHAHADSSDVFVAKLNDDGFLQWNTFLGSASDADEGNGIAVESQGNVYVTGFSDATWGTPKDGHAGSRDAFVFKLNSLGELQWNTFMGASTLDGSGDICVSGYSAATWGSPVDTFTPNTDAFVAKLKFLPKPIGGKKFYIIRPPNGKGAVICL